MIYRRINKFSYRRPAIFGVPLPALGMLLFVLLTAAPAVAQKQGQALVDSLLHELPTAHNDTGKVKILNAISFAYYFINADKGILYGRQALELATKLSWSKGLATAHKNIGNACMGKSDYDMALNEYQQALAIFQNIHDIDGEARVLGNIGSIYDDKGDYTQALEYEYKALKIYEQTGDKKGLARIYNTIGTLYETPKKYKEALGYYLKAYEIHHALGDKQSEAIDMGNAGNNYAYLKLYDNALNFDLRSLSIYEELGDSSAIANKLMNVGSVYWHIKNYPKALNYTRQAMSIYERIDDKQAMAINLGLIASINLGKVENNKKLGTPLTPQDIIDLQNSIQYATKAITIFNSIGAVNELYETYDGLSQAYEMMGDYKQALAAHKTAIVLKDSLFNKDKHIQFANLEKQRATDEIKYAQKETEVQQKLNREMQKNSREKTIIFSTGILILLLAVILVLRQRRISEDLLLNILPAKIAARLKRKEHPIADYFESASVIFIDMISFTAFSERKDPKLVVEVLNDIFTKFDAIAEKHGLEKIKTIGDCYMAVAGLPEPNANHAHMAAAMALEVKSTMGQFNSEGTNIQFRIGLDCGSMVAGVIGKKKFIYDIWGNTVNTASRMETTGLPGEIHCTNNFRNSLPTNYLFTSRGLMDIKGKGQMHTWLLTGVK